MERAEALRRLASMPAPAAGQQFTVDYFRPEDGWGVARLFYEVYADRYPIDHYYIPEQLVERNASGALRNAVARTERGDVIAHMGFFRSSAPYERLYENGVGLVLPDYRSSLAAAFLLLFLKKQVQPKAPMDALYGEPVCHHLVGQKISYSFGGRISGVELDLMPGDTYSKEAQLPNRVSCTLECNPLRDRPQRIYIPARYRDALDLLGAEQGIEREKVLAETPLPAAARSRILETYFEFAQVCRCSALELGGDFEVESARIETRARERGALVLQFFLDMSAPCLGEAVEILRARGFFLAGYAPRWNDNDALLLQKNWTRPDFEHIVLLTRRGGEVLALVREEWEQAARRMNSQGETRA